MEICRTPVLSSTPILSCHKGGIVFSPRPGQTVLKPIMFGKGSDLWPSVVSKACSKLSSSSSQIRWQAVASKTIRVPVLMPLYGRKDYKAEKRRARGRDNGEREEKREITATLRANKGGGRRGGMRFCSYGISRVRIQARTISQFLTHFDRIIESKCTKTSSRGLILLKLRKAKADFRELIQEEIQQSDA
ncbi:hypothetical protein DPX16_18802 [Anabarilius grahami]|uniref:Uncharacterized protein n=1 Tax=Anabarilius grahami TaxID=495550 RepID=A0A3N0Y2Q4_ANAGA|nr:hypothetical protein DPX16_18802 [Anabarilius grahami]